MHTVCICYTKLHSTINTVGSNAHQLGTCTMLRIILKDWSKSHVQINSVYIRTYKATLLHYVKPQNYTN